MLASLFRFNKVRVFQGQEMPIFKSKGPERQDDPVAIEPQGQPQSQPQAMISCIGSSMSIVGNVECRGPAHIFGKIQGELRATELMIGEGAEVDGTVEAEDITISGRVKGTIRALRVKLQGATVEGEIVHRTLSMDENSVFEGTSRRVENPVERRGDAARSSNGAGKPVAKTVMPSPDSIPFAPAAGNGTLQPH
jgi:cytoskeletal protein CcmA (bactofilin family)